MAASEVDYTGIYIENLFKYLRSREEVFGKFFAILVTILGSIGYTFIKTPLYTFVAVVISNLVLLAGEKYINTLSYNYRYLQMGLSKIECLTGMSHYIPNTWNLVAREGDLSETEFIPDIFAGFLKWMKKGSVIITVGGVIEVLFLSLIYIPVAPQQELVKKNLNYLPTALIVILCIIMACFVCLLMIISSLLIFCQEEPSRRRVYDKFQKKFSREKIEEELKASAGKLGVVLDDNLKRRVGK